MNSNGILRKHWFHVTLHFVADTTIFCLAFLVGSMARFGDEAADFFGTHWPVIAASGVLLSSTIYILGLYSTHSAHRGAFERAFILFACTVASVLMVIGGAYALSAHPPGRGVMGIGASAAYVIVVIHHIFLLHALRTARERVAYIVTCPFDEVETRLFANFSGRNLELVGVVAFYGYQPTGETRVLGRVDEIAEIVEREKIDRVLCTTKSLNNATLTRHFCKLRYSGVSVMPLIILCEEIEQYVPIELITPEWLLSASGEPQLLYIKKVKRLFDIVCSVIGLLLGAPLVALAAVAIRLTSPGPIFYRQTRAGRFGRDFQILKLRSMRMDAEKDGAQWSGENDPRVTLVGRFLRRYRIDEIPQLWQVLCGNLSFVGPRPERPEMIQMLATEIPYYQERAMVQPGLTGWAQVSYPYGASVADARRKLEYDLYYMKHMSLFLDVFILLDTVRIVLLGGAAPAARALAETETLQEWVRMKEKEADPIHSVELGAA
ncbi:MAG: exopolysaccharide biosynthesis polyprenyl glycosylphosphotransferase [Chthoniobacter sp.]|nr:exopolysaccharide biosynthesis polyprenyl glycosylphosphotransferase [Chthoniobacter sp.]